MGITNRRGEEAGPDAALRGELSRSRYLITLTVSKVRLMTDQLNLHV